MGYEPRCNRAIAVQRKSNGNFFLWKDADSTNASPKVVEAMNLPSCNSTDVKRLSIAYQEGRFSVSTNSRLRGLVVCAGGPDVVIARATTRGVQQSDLSRKLSPPTKWSYR